MAILVRFVREAVCIESTNIWPVYSGIGNWNQELQLTEFHLVGLRARSSSALRIYGEYRQYCEIPLMQIECGKYEFDIVVRWVWHMDWNDLKACKSMRYVPQLLSHCALMGFIFRKEIDIVDGFSVLKLGKPARHVGWVCANLKSICSILIKPICQPNSTNTRTPNMNRRLKVSISDAYESVAFYALIKRRKQNA